MINSNYNILPVNDYEYSQYFIGLTKSFINNPNSDPQFQKELEFFINYSKKFSQGTDLLEIGCGTGRTLLFLAKEGYNCFGIDFDPMQIKLAEEIKNELRINNICFLNARIGDKIKIDKNFDIVISNDLIEHLPENELLKYFEQVNNLIKNNGIFLIHSKPLKYSYLLKKKFVVFILLFFFLPEKFFNYYLKLLDYLIPRVYKFFTRKNLPDTWQDLPPGHCNPPDEENIRIQLQNTGFVVKETIVYHPGTNRMSSLFRKIVKSKKLNTSIFIFCTKNI
jgi:SAM-dependent methyltransferase